MKLIIVISILSIFGCQMTEAVDDSAGVIRKLKCNQVSGFENIANFDLREDNPCKSFQPDTLVIIYYGLNDSHSRDWVRENKEGTIGITYFQRYEGDQSSGILYYKMIYLDGTEILDTVTTGQRLEKSVLLYDAESNPHIYVARSNDTDQIIEHYYRENQLWVSDTIIHFYGEGGRFIYEMSADKGPDGSFHLLILKTRSDIDSDDFWWAWLDSNLYHLTNASGIWEKELIVHFNMGYTYDSYIKSSIRQDIEIDHDGYVHVVFNEQILASDDPSRLWYATNRSGSWQKEVAMSYDYGVRDDAGWFPSLCLDNDDIPYIACMYVHRYYTRSAIYCRLYLLKRNNFSDWTAEVVATADDGYYGGDGRNYAGGLNHLYFDKNNTPHLIFSDIASSHWTHNYLNVGNIRYGIYKDGLWQFRTIYRQPLPTSYVTATEMTGMALVVSELTDSIRIVGQELVVTAPYQYSFNLLDFAWSDEATAVEDYPENTLPSDFHLSQNYPNPFNSTTQFRFELPKAGHVRLEIYDILGRKIATVIDKHLKAGNHICAWNANEIASGVYFYRIQAGDIVETRKMMLLK